MATSTRRGVFFSCDVFTCNILSCTYIYDGMGCCFVGGVKTAAGGRGQESVGGAFKTCVRVIVDQVFPFCLTLWASNSSEYDDFTISIFHSVGALPPNAHQHG